MVIERNEKKCWGRPSIINRRLMVYDIVFGINSIKNYTEEIELNTNSVKSILEYCANRLCEKNENNGKFCIGCSLSSNELGEIDLEEIVEINRLEITYCINKNDNDFYFLGTKQDFVDQVNGQDGWILAQNLLNKNPKEFEDEKEVVQNSKIGFLKSLIMLLNAGLRFK
jgi:uncharacterized protein (DUF433 family)